MKIQPRIFIYKPRNSIVVTIHILILILLIARKASSSIPVNYDYTRLNVETRTLAVEGQGHDTAMEDSYVPVSSHSNNNNTSLRYFWDGGLLANTPLSQTYIAHIDYWRKVRKFEDNIPSLRFSIINLHPAKQQNLPTD